MGTDQAQSRALHVLLPEQSKQGLDNVPLAYSTTLHARREPQEGGQQGQHRKTSLLTHAADMQPCLLLCSRQCWLHLLVFTAACMVSMVIYQLHMSFQAVRSSVTTFVSPWPSLFGYVPSTAGNSAARLAENTDGIIQLRRMWPARDMADLMLRKHCNT